MFLAILVVVLLAAAIHIARLPERGSGQGGRIALVYVLVGFCGVPMLILSLLGLAAPERAVELFGVPGRNVQGGVALVFLAISVTAVMALRYRGAYLIGPTVAWAVVLGGGTFFHLHDGSAATHGGALTIFATHGLVALLLLAALIWSGLLTKGREGGSGSGRPLRDDL